MAGEFAQGQTTPLVPPHLGVSPELEPSMSQIIFLAYLITSFLLSLLKRPNNNQEQKGKGKCRNCHCDENENENKVIIGKIVKDETTQQIVRRVIPPVARQTEIAAI